MKRFNRLIVAAVKNSWRTTVWSLIVLTTFFFFVFLKKSNRISNEDENTQPTVKYILLYNILPGLMTPLLRNGREAFLRHRCDVTECYVVNDLRRFNRSMDSYDAVVFNMNVLHYSGKVPLEEGDYSRNSKQRFVFFSQEPPMYTWGGSGQVDESEVNLYENYFNWSMSYRNDADITFFYGVVKSKENLTFSKPKIVPKSIDNQSVVVWMASHCPTDGRREDYVRELNRYINVDSYGSCGNIGGCGKSGASGDSPDECYDMIESKYKFYLSFENSLCTDYVTEKFFQILNRNLVPVVYGAADYSRIAPPNSYIDARQFKGPKQLADYLMALDANDALYNDYFVWKNDYIVESGQEKMVLNGFCDLCRKLHQDNEPKIYTKLLNDWLPENQCTSPDISY